MAKKYRALKIAGQVTLGLGLGLVIAELAFSWRDEGAFPHANFYVADAELGVRLEPGASMNFKLRENPRTTIHVNSRGYRGGEWAAPGEGEVIVVGDSQVFGLGVEDDETFSAGLARDSSRPVINAGVPTYGPAEYMAVARELLAERKAKTVVVTLNFANDPFELGRPNRERHAVWDGWAVRSETAPAETTAFPGRRWLFSRSHLVFGVRKWLHARGAATAPDGAELDDPLDIGTPSEGGWQDIVLASKQAHENLESEHRKAASQLASSQTQLASVDKALVANRQNLDRLVAQGSGGFGGMREAIARGQPGDIVRDNRSEASRSIVLTAEMIREAAKGREQILADILAEEKRKGEGRASALLTAEKTLAASREQLRQQITTGVTLSGRPASQFREYLREFKAMCDQHGAELVVVALPIDVQVDRGEWAKYGVVDGPDMSDSLVLLGDLVGDARDLGIRALDATTALRGAQPGAFLDHDIHMTATGHAALAAALAEELKAPVPTPLRLPDPGLPAGTSFPPADGKWLGIEGLRFAGGYELGCYSQLRDGWLRVQCRRQKAKDAMLGVEVLAGGTPATMAMNAGDALSLVTPLTLGQPLTARFHWQSGAHDLEISWAEAGEQRPEGRFIARPGVAAPAVTTPSAAVEGLCKCQQDRGSDRVCIYANDEPVGMSPCRPACTDLWGDPRLAETCAAVFPLDCTSRMACAQNDPLFAPVCPPGQVHAFASNRCFAVCDDIRPCATGECVAWQGGSVCR